MTELVLNAQNAIVGRLASYAAKQALLGYQVSIVNVEHAVFTGRKQFLIQKYLHARDGRGSPFKGPFVPRGPDRFVRRIIRGMLAYTNPRGKEAFKNIMCYRGVPEGFKNKELITVESVDKKRSQSKGFVSVGELCALLGAKVY